MHLRCCVGGCFVPRSPHLRQRPGDHRAEQRFAHERLTMSAPLSSQPLCWFAGILPRVHFQPQSTMFLRCSERPAAFYRLQFQEAHLGRSTLTLPSQDICCHFGPSVMFLSFLFIIGGFCLFHVFVYLFATLVMCLVSSNSWCFCLFGLGMTDLSTSSLPGRRCAAGLCPWP